jgi:hypothetical protein
MRNQNLASAGAIFDANGGQLSGLSFEDHAGGVRAGDDREDAASAHLRYLCPGILAKANTQGATVIMNSLDLFGIMSYY